MTTYTETLAAPKIGKPMISRVPWRTRFAGALNTGNMLAFVAIVLTLGALPFLPHGTTNLFGLLLSGVGGSFVLVAVLLAVAATVISLYKRRYKSSWFALFSLIMAFRLPTAFNSTYPMYGWTYKHLGVIDYIQTYHNVASNVDIYYSWPAFFTLVAWFGDITGVPAVVLAQWFILFIHVAQAFAVYGLARSLARTKFQALAAAFIAEILNWIGQDYFSPQALGFVLAMLVLTMLFNSRKKPMLAWLSLPLFFALTITHQLTPYWVCIVVFAGCVLKFIRPRYMFILYGVIVIGWTALNFHALARYGLFSGFNPLQNAVRPSLGANVFARTVTEDAMKGAAVFTWGSAAFSAVFLFIRSRNRRVDVVMPVIVTFASFALLGGQNYGGEAIFRVLLYSLPGASILIGTMLMRILTAKKVKARPDELEHLTQQRQKRRNVATSFKVALTTLVILGVTCVTLQAQYGTWFVNRITKDSYVVANQMLTSLPVGAYEIGMAPAGPGRSIAAYVASAAANPSYDITLPGMQDKLIGESFKNPNVENRLTLTLQNMNAPITLTWTPQMQDYADYYGIYPNGALQRLLKQLEKDNRWELVVKKSDILVFELKGSV